MDLPSFTNAPYILSMAAPAPPPRAPSDDDDDDDSNDDSEDGCHTNPNSNVLNKITEHENSSIIKKMADDKVYKNNQKGKELLQNQLNQFDSQSNLNRIVCVLAMAIALYSVFSMN